ncbi:MAG: aa3-type cytochrome c oxidase subunit IV [Paracoccaceae bacterium]|nr:aa3-type cytochrome c oxidase subunit IV [Paracoccaceae bacterium]
MSKHEHGKMDISVQEKTFAGYVKFTSWSIVAIIAVLIFLAIVGG